MSWTRFQYKICYSKIFSNGVKNTPLTEFQYKICYSKMFEAIVKRDDFIVFQYKICYSKIHCFSLKTYKSTYFNTKFVIAKYLAVFIFPPVNNISIQNLL